MLWLLSLIVLAGGACVARARWASWSRRGRAAAAALLLGDLLLFAVTWPGALLVSKALTALALPCGLLWVVLLATCLWLYLRGPRRAFALAAAAALAYTLSGSSCAATLLAGWLESDYASIDPLSRGPFDAVIVLGGGTERGPNGRDGLSSNGDRVLLGAQLYLTGRTAALVASGTRIFSRDDSGRDLAMETSRIWLGLGVRAGAIHTITGRTTSEESASLRALIDREQWQRVGVVTSAWHLRRAERLLRAAGVEADPLPADFRGEDLTFAATDLIPTADGFDLLATGCKELLAGVVGR